MDVHDKNARVQKKEEPRTSMDNIQWLRVKYREAMDREKVLLEYLLTTLGDFDYRIKVLERKLKEISP